MKTYLKTMQNAILLIVMITGVSACGQGGGTSSKDKKEIRRVLKVYEKALNESNVKNVLSVYAQDGVFMPSEAPTATGHEQLKASYEYVFKILDLNVVFAIDEIVQQGNFAYVRTISKGDIKIIPKDVILKGDEHRELFVLEKKKGQWKIARYMFNKMSPKKH